MEMGGGPLIRRRVTEWGEYMKKRRPIWRQTDASRRRLSSSCAAYLPRSSSNNDDDDDDLIFEKKFFKFISGDI